MLITLHMFSLSVVCTLNTQLKLLPFKRYTVLRRTVNGNFIVTPTVYLHAASVSNIRRESKSSVFICLCYKTRLTRPGHFHDDFLL